MNLKNGFTIIELMIVVAIIGIIAYKYRSHLFLSDRGQNGKVYVDTVQLPTTT